jgi:hypothetical protein
VAFGALAIQLPRQIQHHLLQNLGIFREMFDADRHVTKFFSISVLTYSRFTARPTHAAGSEPVVATQFS